MQWSIVKNVDMTRANGHFFLNEKLSFMSAAYSIPLTSKWDPHADMTRANGHFLLNEKLSVWVPLACERDAVCNGHTRSQLLLNCTSQHMWLT